AVRRTEVLEHPCTALGGDPGVVAGGEVVVDDDRVVRCSAEGHWRPRQREGGSGQRAVGDGAGAGMGAGDRGCGGWGRGSRTGGGPSVTAMVPGWAWATGAAAGRGAGVGREAGAGADREPPRRDLRLRRGPKMSRRSTPATPRTKSQRMTKKASRKTVTVNSLTGRPARYSGPRPHRRGGHRRRPGSPR